MLEIRLAKRARKPMKANIYKARVNKQPLKLIGSFEVFCKEDDKDLLTVFSLIDNQERLQLENWIAEADFFKKTMNIMPDELEKSTLRLPESLSNALFELYLEAKRHDISFVPNKIMLESLFKKAAQTQEKLSKIKGHKVELIKQEWVNSGKQAQLEKEDLDAKLLFEALLNMNQPLGKTCTELENAANKYRNSAAKIPPAQLREWAGDMKNRNPNKRIKKWAYAAAIDVLSLHDINPTKLIPAYIVARYWGLQHKSELSLKEAQDLFIKQFNISKDNRDTIKNTLTEIFKG